MPDPIQDIIRRYQNDLLGMDAEAIERLTNAYQRTFVQLEAQQAALLQEIAAMQARGETPSKAHIRRMDRFKTLLGETQAQIDRYAAIIEDQVRADAPGAVRIGLDQSEEMIQSAMFGESEVIPEIWATFQRLPEEAVEAMVAALEADSPLWASLNDMAGETAESVGDALVRNILAGKNPLDTAREMANVWGVPLTRAMTTARTEHLRAQRMAALANYRANDHIVKGWIWFASLDTRTCMSCVALHGTVFSLDETMDDHPNGRCTPVPQTRTWAELGIEGLEDPDLVAEPGDGEAWFKAQPEGVQAEMMGPGKYDAWKGGAFTFDQLSKATQDPRWGRTFVEAPLYGLVAEGA